MSFLRDFPGMDSYQGDLGWIVKKILEFQELADTISELQAALVALPETIRTEVTKQVDAALVGINNTLEEYDRRITVTENEVSDLKKLVFNVVAQVSSLYSFIENYTNLIGEQVFNNLKVYIDQWSTELPPCICPVDGELEPINTALRHLYDFYNRGIKVEDFDSLNITAQDFDSRMITARDFDAFGIDVFYSELYASMISPFTGKIEPIATVVSRLAEFHQKAIEVTAFDALALDVETFDGMNITAYNFDWNNDLGGA